MAGQGEQATEVLAFWFVRSRPRQWFAKDPAFDRLLRERFLGLTRRAIGGELDPWGAEAAGGLVLLLDQFPRQIWRDTALASACVLDGSWRKGSPARTTASSSAKGDVDPPSLYARSRWCRHARERPPAWG